MIHRRRVIEKNKEVLTYTIKTSHSIPGRRKKENKTNVIIEILVENKNSLFY